MEQFSHEKSIKPLSYVPNVPELGQALKTHYNKTDKKNITSASQKKLNLSKSSTNNFIATKKINLSIDKFEYASDWHIQVVNHLENFVKSPEVSSIEITDLIANLKLITKEDKKKFDDKTLDLLHLILQFVYASNFLLKSNSSSNHNTFRLAVVLKKFIYDLMEIDISNIKEKNFFDFLNVFDQKITGFYISSTYFVDKFTSIHEHITSYSKINYIICINLFMLIHNFPTVFTDTFETQCNKVNLKKNDKIYLESIRDKLQIVAEDTIKSFKTEVNQENLSINIHNFYAAVFKIIEILWEHYFNFESLEQVSLTDIFKNIVIHLLKTLSFNKALDLEELFLTKDILGIKTLLQSPLLPELKNDTEIKKDVKQIDFDKKITILKQTIGTMRTYTSATIKYKNYWTIQFQKIVDIIEKKLTSVDEILLENEWTYYSKLNAILWLMYKEIERLSKKKLFKSSRIVQWQGLIFDLTSCKFNYNTQLNSWNNSKSFEAQILKNCIPQHIQSQMIETDFIELNVQNTLEIEDFTLIECQNVQKTEENSIILLEDEKNLSENSFCTQEKNHNSIHPSELNAEDELNLAFDEYLKSINNI